jgi:flagellar biosynthesis chaperone FliJ
MDCRTYYQELQNKKVDAEKEEIGDCEAQLLSLETRMKSLEGEQATEEEDMFASWVWVMEHCQGDHACIRFTKALTDRLDNAERLRNAHDQSAHACATMRGKLDELHRDLKGMSLRTQAGARAAAGIDSWTRR